MLYDYCYQRIILKQQLEKCDPHFLILFHITGKKFTKYVVRTSRYDQPVQSMYNTDPQTTFTTHDFVAFLRLLCSVQYCFWLRLFPKIQAPLPFSFYFKHVHILEGKQIIRNSTAGISVTKQSAQKHRRTYCEKKLSYTE